MTPEEKMVTTFHGEVISIDEAIRRFEISPVIERFGTWVVTTYGVECLCLQYFIGFERIDEQDWGHHMALKKWVILDDFGNALHFARKLKKRRVDFMKSGKPLKVFFCHAKEDKLVVRDMYNRLIVRGIQPWFDEEDILPGQDWSSEIKKAVKSSDVVIVFLSRKSVDKTGFVQKEIKIALDAAEERPEDKIFLIPAKIEECNVPDRLTDKQWVDLYTDKGFERLIQSLHVCCMQS